MIRLPQAGIQLNIRATGDCNADCSFCGYNRTRIRAERKRGYQPYRLDVDQLLADLPRLYDKGVRTLHFTGGEPLLEKRLPEIIVHARRIGFSVRSGTNGSTLDQASVVALKESGIDYLWYSLDTFPFSAHLEHRGFSARAEKMATGIELLRRHQINFFGQSVISHLIPKRPDGLPDLEGLIDYYEREFGIKRFVFSYPMQRDNNSASEGHLATLGSEAVQFEPAELLAIFRSLIELKLRRRDLIIVNPYLSLLQQIAELENQPTLSGCYAGHSIFFLGDDQRTLRPCYFYSDRIVDTLDSGDEIQRSDDYRNCDACRDQCFRDPSILYHAAHSPGHFLQQSLLRAGRIKFALRDLVEVVRHRGYRGGNRGRKNG